MQAGKITASSYRDGLNILIKETDKYFKINLVNKKNRQPKWK